MSIGPWTDEENDLIVADYFVMLADDISARRYSNPLQKFQRSFRRSQGVGAGYRNFICNEERLDSCFMAKVKCTRNRPQPVEMFDRQ